MELVEVTVHYLEMLAPTHRAVPAPRDGLTVVHVESPSVPYYRSLYNAVGNDYYWLSRRKMTDEALAAILGNERNELHVLQVDGTPAGFAELDRRQPDEIELVQFGLIRDFIGQARLALPGSERQRWFPTVEDFYALSFLLLYVLPLVNGQLRNHFLQLSDSCLRGLGVL